AEPAGEAAALVVDLPGDGGLEDDEQGALRPVACGRNALAAESELEPAGASRRDRQGPQPVERRDLDFGPEDGLGDGHRDLDREVAPLAVEIRVGFDVDKDGQVACGRALLAGLALAAEPEPGARLDPGGALHDERFAAVVAF